MTQRQEDQQLVILSKGRALVLSVKSVKEAVTYAAQAQAVATYAKKIGMSSDIEREALELRLRFERKAGELLKELPKAKAGRKGNRSNPRIDSPPTFKEQGIDHHDAHRYQKLAAIPEGRFEASLSAAKEAGEKASASRIITGGAHVGKNTGEFEWYTPEWVVEAARSVMRDIDLDPASTAEANRVVKAKRFYSAKDDGLSKTWDGRVFLNPPYSQPLINNFADKMVQSYTDGDTTQACVLVNNATETAWFQTLAKKCDGICFPAGRVKFWNPALAAAAPLQGQAILYFGGNGDLFASTFKAFGFVR